MANSLENLPFGGHSWFIEMTAEEPTSIEPYLPGEKVDSTDNHESKVPEVIGILPIRNAVAYPGTVTPLAIGRERSKALLADTRSNESIIGLVTQRNPQTDKPGFADLYSVGTAATVLKVIKMPQGSINVIVHGIGRFRIVEPVATEPYLKAKIQALNVRASMTKRLRALIVSVRQTANRVIALSPNVPEEASVLLENIEDPSALADFLAANLSLEIAKKQEILEELDPAKRLEKISVVLASQLEVLELSHKIQSQVRESIDKNQREYFLQEQLKAIQSELGQKDLRTEELKQLADNIAKAKMPATVEEEALRELDRLSKIPAVSPEYTVIRTYLDWVCELPWSIQTEDRLDINQAERILNCDHYNLSKVKKRILEFLAVRKLNPTGKSPILCFVGPPGVATALAYTPVGGELLFIESASMPGKGNLLLTGQIGDVMKESAQAAFSILKANAKKLKIEVERFSKFDYHIHVPAGAIPKDGPSAGVAIFTSLVSLLLGKSTRPDVAMTGEITLRGLVLPIGGLKEKILAAKQAGIKTVILPARNKKDLPEVPKEAKKGLKFEFVKNTDEALKIAVNTG